MLECYNVAAANMSLLCRQLRWDEVVEYTFLLEFDLLRDVRQDLSCCPWATPVGRQAMDSYFKRCRAEEEIIRLNMEICWLITYIRDEEHYLRACKDTLKAQHPELAHQIYVKHNVCSHFHRSHLQPLHAISQLPGFSGMLSPDYSKWTGLGESGSSPVPIIPSHLCRPQPLLPARGLIMDDDDDGLGDEVGVEEGVKEASCTLQDMLIVCAEQD